MIDIEWEGRVAVIHQRNGENRFNRTSVDRWHAILDELEETDCPFALVTTGDGKFYSNGLDLDWMMANQNEANAFLHDVHRLLGRILAFPAITVAAVNGHAFAGGAMLATAHDFVVMRENRGYWCIPEVDLGLPLTAAMHAVLSAKLPVLTAHEAMMTGKRYTAREAMAVGIAHQSAPDGAVLAAAVEIAAEYAGKNRGVIGTHKLLSYGSVLDIIDQG